jgi:hypothetical protein
VAVALLLRYTRFGLHVFAVGSNEATARLCGVPVGRVKVLVYTLGGAFAGVAGLLQFSRLTVGDPTVAAGTELDVIAAVVIGGGSLSGGQGTVTGSLLGALIMSTIRAGCSQMGLPNWVQEIVTGTIIVTAVTLDQLRHRRGREGGGRPDAPERPASCLRHRLESHRWHFRLLQGRGVGVGFRKLRPLCFFIPAKRLMKHGYPAVKQEAANCLESAGWALTHSGHETQNRHSRRGSRRLRAIPPMSDIDPGRTHNRGAYGAVGRVCDRRERDQPLRCRGSIN